MYGSLKVCVFENKVAVSTIVSFRFCSSLKVPHSSVPLSVVISGDIAR